MKKKYIKPETMVICTEPVVICAGSTGWNNDGEHQGNVYPNGGGDNDFDESDWGTNN